MRTIDANVILRYLTNDIPEQAKHSEDLLKRVEKGNEDVFLPDIILADIIWILEGYYKQTREDIREWVTAILSLQGLVFSDKDIALNALDIYVDKKIDWSDAFTASQMLQREINEIYSFDKHFDKIDGIARIEL
ncbi:tRNA(fMet)-specific endonuclease VapC [Sporotomaculum syntrophicum]|uniref:tRNA(fMet)-specific endonuclease VapC n=1 Tax=Sporotomaculum syntrophicum TaxID=182264 RepID=A0A9D2WPY4_9FIRM|nr:PIN domain-containing protein [Sporotomaculum syntrophicum]KAF1085472.1 tRNA(fMet)-specific endonuclease VapC [Sporotomaculum syntrophicum]